ncbi:MAG: glycoside hydrolase family 28 protein [Eubacterium sp.]|nr:glycoside hydrolase family 28 protein [Eubacterium sp.]
MNYNILDYGAVGDGMTVNTSAIQKAIDECTANGGGKVIIPTGRFLSGTIMLKTNVNMYLEAGAELISSLDPADMIDFMKDFDDDNKDTGWAGGCFLLARHAENITISGEGRIDGRGREVFYEDDADGGSHESPLKVRGFRPRMSFLEDIKNLTVRDVTFYDAAFWTLHMAGCRDVLIENIRIENNDRGPNNDGIDPDCCQNVIIRGCRIACADDCIVVKTTAPMTEKYGPCCNILISGCILYSHSSALKIGTETWGDIHHITMSDCIMENCTRGIGIWSRDGGRIHDIMIHHISGNTLRYKDRAKQDSEVVVWWGKGDPVFLTATKRAGVERLPGVIEDITLDHIRMDCEGTIMIAGEEYSPIKNVTISDSTFTWKKQGTTFPDCFDEQPSARGVYKHETPCIYIRNGENISLEDKVVLRVEDSLKEYIQERIINE